jgi:hypothetical protein
MGNMLNISLQVKKLCRAAVNFTNSNILFTGRTNFVESAADKANNLYKIFSRLKNMLIHKVNNILENLSSPSYTIATVHGFINLKDSYILSMNGNPGNPGNSGNSGNSENNGNNGNNGNNKNKDDEEEFDRTGYFANEQAIEMVDDLHILDMARKGDNYAMSRLSKKYPHFNGDWDKLEKVLESDFFKEKRLRDRDNIEAGRSATTNPLSYRANESPANPQSHSDIEMSDASQPGTDIYGASDSGIGEGSQMGQPAPNLNNQPNIVGNNTQGNNIPGNNIPGNNIPGNNIPGNTGQPSNPFSGNFVQPMNPFPRNFIQPTNTRGNSTSLSNIQPTNTQPGNNTPGNNSQLSNAQSGNNTSENTSQGFSLASVITKVSNWLDGLD